MPELPEVEITRLGITPHVTRHRIATVVIRRPSLRWPIPGNLQQRLVKQKINAVTRRGKYLLLKTTNGTVIIHLGMSGTLRILTQNLAATRHDHVDFVFEDGSRLRLNDPRRFGAVLWSETDPETHPLLSKLGPEPLENDFSGSYLHRRAQGRRAAIKSFIMNSAIVPGIGNIYACESLYLAGIHPALPAGQISLQRSHRLAAAIKQTLQQAIECGGTTLRDFLDSSGKPGYFQLRLGVYGRAGAPCHQCGKPVQSIRQAQRTTFYCSRCQT